jgi:hypothetical protein
MAQFSVKIMRLTGSVLGENQHSLPISFQTPKIGAAYPKFGVMTSRAALSR